MEILLILVGKHTHLESWERKENKTSIGEYAWKYTTIHQLYDLVASVKQNPD